METNNKKRGRPVGTTKKELEERKSNSIMQSKDSQLANVVPDADERQALLKRIVGNAYNNYKNAPCQTDDECEIRINKYFEECVEKGNLPTVEGLALSLGVTCNTINSWQLGQAHSSRAGMINQAKQLIAEIDAQLTLSGKMPPVPYIFRAKNYYGMTDKNEVEVRAVPLETVNEDELKQRINDTIIDVDIEDEEEDK